MSPQGPATDPLATESTATEPTMADTRDSFALPSWLGPGVRVAGLTVVIETMLSSNHAPGLSGRALVVLVGLVLAAAALSLQWLRPRIGERAALAASAAGLIGGAVAAIACPHSAAVALPAIAAMDAVVLFTLAQALVLVAVAELTLCVVYLIVEPSTSLLSWCLIVLLGLTSGLWRRPYRLRAEQAELLLAERERTEQERLRADVASERARIARDVHDVLAHSFGALVVQLEAADALLEHGESERARQAVRSSRALAVDGLREASGAVGALREEPLALPRMLRALGAQHGDADVEIVGDVEATMAPSTGLSLYRAAQEALSNARKHAPGLPVHMRLSFKDAETVLEVVNDTPAGQCDSSALARSGAQQGLLGLRERAELLGGELHAGPADGGWRVEMRIPR